MTVQAVYPVAHDQLKINITSCCTKTAWKSLHEDSVELILLHEDSVELISLHEDSVELIINITARRQRYITDVAAVFYITDVAAVFISRS